MTIQYSDVIRINEDSSTVSGVIQQKQIGFASNSRHQMIFRDKSDNKYNWTPDEHCSGLYFPAAHNHHTLTNMDSSINPVVEVNMSGNVLINTDISNAKLNILDSAFPQLCLAQATDKTVLLKADSSGYLTITASGSRILIPDGDKLYFGSQAFYGYDDYDSYSFTSAVCLEGDTALTIGQGLDLTIGHDGTNSIIGNGTGKLIFDHDTLGNASDMEYLLGGGSLVVSGGSLKPNFSIVLDPTSAEVILTENSGAKSQSVAGINRVSWEPAAVSNDLILTMTGGEDGQVVYIFNTDTTYYVDVVNPTFSGVYSDYPDVPPVSSRRFIYHANVWCPEGSSY
jgi:hypothetical protein